MKSIIRQPPVTVEDCGTSRSCNGTLSSGDHYYTQGVVQHFGDRAVGVRNPMGSDRLVVNFCLGAVAQSILHRYCGEAVGSVVGVGSAAPIQLLDPLQGIKLGFVMDMINRSLLPPVALLRNIKPLSLQYLRRHQTAQGLFQQSVIEASRFLMVEQGG